MGIIWAVAGLFAVISIVLLCGKGGMLIAGYNTSSDAEKKRYDEKKLCRTMGIGMSVITVLLVVMAVMGENLSSLVMMIFIGAVIVDIAFMMYWTSHKCFVVDSKGNPIDVKDSQIKKNSKVTAAATIFMIIVFMVVGIILMTGSIKTSCTDNAITIESTYWKDAQISYSDITSVTLSETNVAGSRNAGFGSFKLALGRFEDKAGYGMYTRYTYISSDYCIIIETKENGLYVINAESDKETRVLYEEIESARK